MSDSLTFGAQDLARATGCPLAVAELTFERLAPPELVYRPLPEARAAATVAEIEEIIRDKPLRVVGADDPTAWERGWAELADRLAQERVTIETLRPQYFHAGAPCRLFGELVEQVTPHFEYWVGLCVRFAIFAEFLCDRSHVVEFGCGTGINLLLLGLLHPEARLVGCDWAAASQDILMQMARETGQEIEAHRFNMLTATGDCGPIGPDTAVMTVHALEQLGANWQPFLDFLVRHRPGVCVHIEPLVELYDASAPLDDLARRYHLKRHYLQGFAPAIERLAADGAADIMALRRTRFSGLYQEAYSVLVWRVS